MEPVVEIPARILLRIAKLLDYVNTDLFPDRAKMYSRYSDILAREISRQLTDDEVKTVIIAAKIEDSAIPNPPGEGDE